MKKKYYLFLLVFTVIGSVFAGDIPESLFSNPEVDLLFIGTIIEETEHTSTIKPYLVMKGNFFQKKIIVDKINKYYGTSDKPKVNDTILGVLMTGGILDNNRIFKTTGKDYATLKLVSKKYPMVENYQKYINQGKYIENNLYREYIEANYHGSFQYWYILFGLISFLVFFFLLFFKKHDLFLIKIWSISQIFLWSSLFITDWFLNRGGFPIKAFVYPNCGSCGSDFPNEGSFLTFLLNWLIRIIISILLIYIFPKIKIKNNKLIITSFMFIMIGLFYLLIKFD